MRIPPEIEQAPVVLIEHFDKATSRLAQGTSAHSALVEVERFDGEPPAILAHEPPPIVAT